MSHHPYIHKYTDLVESEATVPSECADFFWSLVRLREPHWEVAGELLWDDGLRELLSEPGDCGGQDERTN